MKNETIKTLLNHRSVRKYKETPIPEEIVTLIIQAGTRAATGGNLQMYSFLVVDEKEKLQLFEAELQPIIQSPPLIIIALLDLHRIKRWLEVNESQTPVLDRPAYFMLGLWDALIALHNENTFILPNMFSLPV
jgi:FMN reductase (NADPH)